LWEREGAVFGLLQEKGGGGLCWMVRECRERGLHGQMERRWGGGGCHLSGGYHTAGIGT